jgi:beta-glucosidase
VALTICTGFIPFQNDAFLQEGTVISEVYFYGESPPVYPSPLANGTGDWASAYESAAALVARLSMEEKVCL